LTRDVPLILGHRRKQVLQTLSCLASLVKQLLDLVRRISPQPTQTVVRRRTLSTTVLPDNVNDVIKRHGFVNHFQRSCPLCG
jgi:hypothetical protein